MIGTYSSSFVKGLHQPAFTVFLLKSEIKKAILSLLSGSKGGSLGCRVCHLKRKSLSSIQGNKVAVFEEGPVFNNPDRG